MTVYINLKSMILNFATRLARASGSCKLLEITGTPESEKKQTNCVNLHVLELNMTPCPIDT